MTADDWATKEAKNCVYWLRGLDVWFVDEERTLVAITAALLAAERRGMMRAAEIAESHCDGLANCVCESLAIAKSIRAAAVPPEGIAARGNGAGADDGGGADRA